MDVTAGGYRCIPAVFQYSAGVAALPGHRIERARFLRPVPLAEGWRRIAAHLAALGRSPTAFCACELRSPAPFTEAGFTEFNRAYAEVSRTAHELQKIGPQLVNLKIKNEVAILYSVDSANALDFMPFGTLVVNPYNRQTRDRGRNASKHSCGRSSPR